MTRCSYIDDYMEAIRSGKIPAPKEIHQAMDLIERKLSDSDIVIDIQKAEKAAELIERYFNFKLMAWELFILALVHCYYRSEDAVVFKEFLIMMGRGNGKNGFISGLSWYLTTKYHGISGYNVDIIANSEDQAKVSFSDIYETLSHTWEQSRKFFYKSKVEIRNLNTRSYIQYNTSNARTKDGKRSACLIFDEIHEYENDETIRVFRSGFGKRKHSRIFYITTNGYVREGVLDDKLRIAQDVLSGKIEDSRLCPLIYKMDEDKEVEHPELWVKANPSILDMPLLKQEMKDEYKELAYDDSVKLDFFTKRMNLPRSDMEIAVTKWENIEATNRPLPDDLEGRPCVVGVDFATIDDLASVDVHFQIGEQQIDICRSWLCKQSRDLNRIKAPWEKWVERGLITLVDDVEIPPQLLAEYIKGLTQKYNVLKVAIDHYRYPVVREALREIGIDDGKDGKLKRVRPSDITMAIPIISSCFNNKHFIWGDDPHLRWAANNTKLVRSGRKTGEDTGNYYYAKIEGKSRKTDPFMALAAAMTVKAELENAATVDPSFFTVYTF